MANSQDIEISAHSDSEISVDDGAENENPLPGQSLLDLEDLEDDVAATLPSAPNATASWDSGADWASPALDNHGWGVSAPSTPQRLGNFPWKNRGWVPDHMRINLEESGWTLNGTPQRDLSLDGLSSKEWAPVQLFRLTNAGRNGNVPAPTFTRAQVATRLGDIVSTISEKRRTVAKLERNISALEGAATRMRVRKDRAEAQMREIQATCGDLEDLHLAAMSFGRA
ncbi:hypothetical protein V5O48_013514 [Marasmius crinis-equi]|uniref:Uncharacterized protein n=1 Tax=Marasmius crinis-equi TaxID=585013 RepID=A0ABR3EZU9_9AGAR